jgi:hypothetical protein
MYADENPAKAANTDGAFLSSFLGLSSLLGAVGGIAHVSLRSIQWLVLGSIFAGGRQILRWMIARVWFRA